MGISTLIAIESSIRSFFASLAASLTFDLLFIIGLSLQAVAIIFFVIKTHFSYELRMTRALDRVNKWLFVNKKITADNIKEFTTLTKKAPKRLGYNWQQYILFREKAPSEYLTAENLIEKPLRASSLKSNIRNLSIISGVLSFLIFIAGISHNNTGDTVLNASMLIVALITPLLMLLLLVITVISLNARRNSNLDELYQNHHLFQRFIDNACVDLPAFIDFTLLFSVQEIEKGIPALREFLESRARKEKEEFEKARNAMVIYEKYDFEKAGIDGSNILERAMNESEAFLSNKNKTLATISQFEASLESLKKNFDNIQKDFQKKMQVSKENIDRLRQQQVETTSRIESNFLRKQQATEIAKQEKEEADFEQQKRRYLVEKNDYEEEINRLNAELDSGREDVERAMIAEYQTFYKRVCQNALENVEEDIKQELAEAKKQAETSEEELAITQTLVKRLQDENATLRKKLESEEVAGKTKSPEKVEAKPKEEKVEIAKIEEPVISEEIIEEPIVEEANIAEPIAEEVKIEEVVLEEPVQEYVQPVEEAPEINQPVIEPVVEEVDVEYIEEQPKEEVVAPARKRGRPAGSTKQKMLEKTEAPRGRGRPKKVVAEEVEDKEPKKRGRPVGSKNKVNSPSVKKRAAAAKAKAATGRGRGRPRKVQSAAEINNKIEKEEQRLQNIQNDVNESLTQTLKEIDTKPSMESERIRLINEIEEIKIKAANAQDATAEELEEMSQKIESLLEQINQLED